MTARVAVVGGGVSGLAAALFARDAGFEVALHEASDRFGGALSTRREGGFLMEGGPDSFVRTKPASLKLCERLGVDLIGTQDLPQAGARIVRGGRLLALPSGLQLLAPTKPLAFALSGILSWKGKLRVLREPSIPVREGASEDDDESLASFVRRRLGDEALDRLAQPLVAGIFSGDPETLSLRATMPRLLDLERDHGSLIAGMQAAARGRPAAKGARYDLFRTPASGMQTVVDALVERLELDGVTLTTGAPVTDLAAVDADHVVLALPAAAAGRLLDGPLADALGELQTTSSATISFGWEAPVADNVGNAYGYVAPAVEGRFCMAATVAHNKYEGRAPFGGGLVRAFVGGALGPDVTELDDDTLIERARADVGELLRIDAPPDVVHLTRHHHAQPQYVLGHLDRVARIEALAAEAPRIVLAGNSYRGVGVADCVASARRAVDSLVE